MSALPTSARMGLLGSLYFSQGLPFGFFVQALPLLLRAQGASLSAIGLTSLLALPWALKFLWAPLVDRLEFHGVGRRKSWILPLQLYAAAILAGLAVYGGAPSAFALMAAALVVNLVSATQDVASDGLAVDLLPPEERGLANGLQVAAYRLGMIVGGGFLLVVYERYGARAAFLVMAGLLLLASVPVLLMREPPPRPAAPDAPAKVHFLRRPGAWGVLALVIAYKAGESFATGMLRPFLADAGLGLADVGWLIGTAGFVAGLAGALAGGGLVGVLGRREALLAFGLLQALTVAGYAWLSVGEPSRPALYAICAAEHFAGGMATAALFTCMMDWCGRDSSATDYTVQASAVVIATGAAAAVAGFSAEMLGYTGHFALAAALALAALAAVYAFFPTPEQAATVRGERGF